MTGYREILAEKIKYLPDDKIVELIHLFDFFIKDTDTGKKGGILLSLSGSLSGSPVSSEDMDRQLYGDIKKCRTHGTEPAEKSDRYGQGRI